MDNQHLIDLLNLKKTVDDLVEKAINEIATPNETFMLNKDNHAYWQSFVDKFSWIVAIKMRLRAYGGTLMEHKAFFDEHKRL